MLKKVIQTITFSVLALGACADDFRVAAEGGRVEIQQAIDAAANAADATRQKKPVFVVHDTNISHFEERLKVGKNTSPLQTGCRGLACVLM